MAAILLDSGLPLLAVLAVLGLVIGSFLNVAIHRLPREGQSVWHPHRSFCPSCGRVLGWRENLPLLSWLLQGGRCRGCKWRIPVRYPLVEALTAGLFVLAGAVTPAGQVGLLLVHCAVLAGLVVSSCVDLEHFEIPDEISIGGMVFALLAALALPELHAETRVAQYISGPEPVDRAGALAGALAGMAVGGGVLLAIGALGRRVYGREAMGLGDVKLLAAGGGLVGPGGAVVVLMIGALLAALMGIQNLVRFAWISFGRSRRRGGQGGVVRALKTGRIAARYIPFGPYLGIGIGIVLLGWNDVTRLSDIFLP